MAKLCDCETLPRAHQPQLCKQLRELWAEEVREAAEAVCEFDWSDNDPDACAAIDRLRKAVDA